MKKSKMDMYNSWCTACGKTPRCVNWFDGDTEYVMCGNCGNSVPRYVEVDCKKEDVVAATIENEMDSIGDTFSKNLILP